MIVNFLQCRNQKILPCLQQQPFFDPVEAGPPGFNDRVDELKGFGEKNKESLGELLFAFFRRYAHEIDYERNVISVREGGLISKQSKKWHLMQNNRLCVEEPFNTDRNLGNTADDTSFRGVHLELRRAFDLISSAKLAECCEEYIFPPHEERFWSKPAPQPRPVLTRSLSQSGRSSKQAADKKGTPNQKHRNSSSNRRTSSAASMNKMYPNMQSGERMIPGNQLHDQLYLHYQMLQQQEQQLRLQMHQRAQATIHAQVTAQVQQPLQVHPVPYAQQNNDTHRRHSNIDPPPLSAPLRSVQTFYYPMSMVQNPNVQNMSPSLPNSQNGTTPPSPSQPSAQPATDLRRNNHRSMTSDSAYGTLRSHSQPPANMKTYPQNARSHPTNPYGGIPQGQLLGLATLQQYQQVYLQKKHAEGESVSGDSSQSGSMMLDPRQDPGYREYLGYYMDQPQQMHTNLLPPNGYNDQSSRARTVSPNLSRPYRQHSRSPSPSHRNLSASRSINFFSTDAVNSPTLNYSVPRRDDSQSNGPVIVDGSSETSDYATPPESFIYHSARSEAASSLSDDRAMDTPSSSAATPVQEIGDPLILDGNERSASMLPNVLQFGDFPARATFRSSQSRPDDSKPVEKPTIPRIRKESIVDNNGRGMDINLAKFKDMTASLPQKPQSSTVAGLNLASSLKPLTVLSPVREVRTPSPTATRSNSLLAESQKLPSKGNNKEMVSSPLAAESSASNEASMKLAREKKDVKIPELANSDSSSKVLKQDQQHQSQLKPNQTATWQSGSSKKKKNKKAASVGSVTLPFDPNDRKGG
jgi:hypothetical protein